MGEGEPQLYRNVTRQLRRGRLTPFLGAGVNLVGVDLSVGFQKGRRLPSGAELASLLTEEYEYDGEDPHDLVRVAQWVELTIGRADLEESLREVFNRDFPPTVVHELLARTPDFVRQQPVQEFPLIITTNYDDALERAFEARGESIDVLTYVAHGPDRGLFRHTGPDGETTVVSVGDEYAEVTLRARPAVVKLHGAVSRSAADDHVEDDSYVLTEDDYIECLSNPDIVRHLPCRGRPPDGAVPLPVPRLQPARLEHARHAPPVQPGPGQAEELLGRRLPARGAGAEGLAAPARRHVRPRPRCLLGWAGPGDGRGPRPGRGAHVTATAVAPLPGLHAGRGPYQGLMPYTEDRHRFFFGRDRDIGLIASNARAYRFCLLYGLSGVGKSSVLQAGAVRSIRDETAVRRAHFDDEPVETVVAYLKDWRDDPVSALWAAVLAGFRHEGLSAPADAPVPGNVSAAIAAVCDAHDVDLVMILDQFEEFFLYHSADVPDFGRMVAELTGPRTRGNVLISMREDALSRLDEFEGIVPGVFDHTLRLEHLDEASARSAVVEPLRTYNEEVSDAERREIEPALVDRLLLEVRAGQVQVDSTQEAAAGAAAAAARTVRGPVRIEAPFLQLVLTRLWEEEARRGSRVLRLATLEELGGAQAIVSQHLDRVMAAFTVAEQAVLTDAFGHLVTPSGSKIAHRPSDLAAFSKQDPAVMNALLRRLAEGDQRILREVPPPLDEPQAEPRYEIFHDVLALAVLDWRRRRVADAEVHETRRRLRRVTGLAAVMALMLVACLAVGAWALHSRSVAEQARADALDRKEQADLNQKLGEVNALLGTDPAAALLEAGELRLDEAHDPNGRFQDAYRRALEAADTDVIVQLGSPAVLADFVDGGFVTVTEDGHVRLWETDGDDPLRLDEDLAIDVTLPEDSGRVVQAFTAADGQFVVVRTDAGAVSSVDLSAGDLASPDVGFDLGPNASVSAAASGARDEVLVWDYAGHGAVWDVADNSVASSHAFDEPVVSADIDAEGAHVAVLSGGDFDYTAQVWSTDQDQLVDEAPLESHTDQTISFGWVRFTSTVGPQLAIVGLGWQTEMSLWDVGAGDPTPVGKDEPWRQVYDVADVFDVRADGDEGYNGFLAVAGDKRVTLFDAKGETRGQLRTRTADFRDWATEVEVNPQDTAMFAVVSNEGYVDVYEQHLLTPPRPRWTFRGHSGRITSAVWSDDGERLATASEDGTVRIWRLPEVTSTWYSADWILAAKPTADGAYQFGFTPGGYVIRSAADGRFKQQFVSEYGQLIDMDPAPDGQAAVVIDEYCYPPDEVRFGKKEAVELDQPDEGICPTGVAWNPDPDAHQIVAGDYSGKVHAWDADTRKVTASVEVGPATAAVQDLAYSGDGKLLVVLTSSGQDGATGAVSVLRSDDLSVVTTWPASDLSSVDVSADGRYVVTAGNENHLVQVWDTEDVSEPTQVLKNARGAGTLSTVALSRDEDTSWLAVATASGRVYIWERETGRLLSVVAAHEDAANAVAFDRTQTDVLISAGDDGEAVSFTCDLCSMGTDDLREAAEQREAQVVEVG